MLPDRKDSSGVTTRRGFIAEALALGGVAALRPAFASAAASQPASAPKTAPASAPAERWRIGCSTRPWDGQDYHEALQAIAEAGYRYVGLMTGKPRGVIVAAANTPEQTREVRDALDRHGLRVITVYGGEIPVGTSPQAGIDPLKKLIDHCAVVASETVMLAGTSNVRLYDAYYRAVAACCEYAAERRIMIVLKPHGGLNTNGPQCRKAIARVGHPNFRLWYDAGNIFFYTDGKLDPVHDSTMVTGLVTGWCIKDYKHPKEVFVNPGEGRVNFGAVFATLRRGGFTSGPLMVETVARGDPPTLLANARNARLFVEKLVGAAAPAAGGG